MKCILTTERLHLRELVKTDWQFVISLLNSEGWLRYIGERNVHTQAEAEAYIQHWLNSYEKNGFGLWVVQEQDSRTPQGLCGLIRRDTLPHVDIGFAFLPEYIGKGYGSESAKAVLHYGFETIGLDKIIAITLPDNHASCRLLQSLGMIHEGDTEMSGDLLHVYAINKPLAK
jgi:[ribosomal protein S5]-alanine N-acetyltransferase